MSYFSLLIFENSSKVSNVVIHRIHKATFRQSSQLPNAFPSKSPKYRSFSTISFFGDFSISFLGEFSHFAERPSRPSFWGFKETPLTLRYDLRYEGGSSKTPPKSTYLTISPFGNLYIVGGQNTIPASLRISTPL